MWDPPRPGLEPVSPALAGRCLTTAPPGKPQLNSFTPVGIVIIEVADVKYDRVSASVPTGIDGLMT